MDMAFVIHGLRYEFYRSYRQATAKGQAADDASPASGLVQR